MVESKVKKETKTKKATSSKYFEAVGRRKASIARVRLFKSDKNSYSINGKGLKDFFKTASLQNVVTEALQKSAGASFDVSAFVTGGGIKGQAESIRLGISRALISFDLALRGELKRAGFLKRDPRIKERKKFGLKKARKSPQWSKR